MLHSYSVWVWVHGGTIHISLLISYVLCIPSVWEKQANKQGYTVWIP